MYILSYAGLLLGLIILTLLVSWHGFSDIFHLLSDSGWGLLTLPFIWFPCLLIATISWRMLFAAKRIPPYSHVLAAIWMGRAINTLLPVATIGGEIAKARLITLWGGSGIEASASVMVDKTVQALALIPWGFIGVFLLFYLAVDNSIAIPAMIGFSLLGLGILGFVLVQHTGLFSFMAKLIDRFIRSERRDGIANHAREIDLRVVALYKEKGRFALSVFWRTLSLMLETGEVWLACYLFGHPIAFLDAMMLKSLTSTLNNIVFFIPNAYGVQEGGYVLIGGLIGFSPEFSLAVSLATRVRELLIDLPGLLVWQHIENRQFLNKKQRTSGSMPD